MSNAEVIADFTVFITKLGCLTLGLDAGSGMMAEHYTHQDKNHYYIRMDCSDKFDFATGDSENIGSVEDLELYKKVAGWFLVLSYEELPEDFRNRHYPTLESYLEDEYYILDEELEKSLERWGRLAYCMLKRGHEVHPYYWIQCPDWLKEKLVTEGVGRSHHRLGS